ncbi:MAG TPA: FxSxx-COOH system tetratricopeptide repeat protein, partial [Ktedonobacteraceae bacterium]|nr:FxSxx-COOH system tetratricopeptide repeat protein [Ktedonobacteraceae bacterium]
METTRYSARNRRLRQARIERNWRQRDLAEQLGTTMETVKRWERGSQQPSTYFRIKLITLFGKSAEELGLLENDVITPANEQKRSTGKQALPAVEPLGLWTIPYPRNPHFTGRDDLLEQLALRLSPVDSEGTRRAVLAQPEAIKGLGGIGKTQIALEYAYRAREQNRYVHTFWMNAASEETLLSSFTALARLLPSVRELAEKDQRKLIGATIQWLEQCQHSWLLIFDNADELSLVQPYLPHQGLGSLLLTTRAHAVTALAAPMEVEPLGILEGTRFLLHRTQRLEATDEEINEATNVVMALDGFPLALDQAGAYIEETGCDFRGYLQLYHNHRHALLARRGAQNTHYPDSVDTTWSLSFQQIEHTNPAAADLLRLCAFLAPDHIPEELLRDGASHWPPLLQKTVGDLLAFNQILEDLLKFSLIKRLGGEHLLSIHRLVQAVQRERMGPAEQLRWARCVVYGLHAIFPANCGNDLASWPRCQRYLEQVQVCGQLIQQYKLEFSEAADLLNRVGIYLREQALYALAEPLFQQAAHIWEQQGEPDVASPLYGLAEMYRKQGKYREAEPLFQRALSIQEQLLGPEHPDATQTLNGLATLYMNQGKYAEAEPLFLRILELREQQLEQQLERNHPNVAQTLHHLAILYYKLGNYTEAEKFYLYTLSLRKQQLGLHHQSVALVLGNLGTLYIEIGKYTEAESFLQQARSIWEQLLGSHHMHIATPLSNLGQLYIEIGKYTEAESFLQQARSIWEQSLGPGHRAVAFTCKDLAHLYVRQGKYTEAESLYQRALHIWEQTPGSEQSPMAEVLGGLANLYREQRKYEQAEPLYLRALAIREQRLGTEHSSTASSLNNLADLYRVRGLHEQAESLYLRALAIREQRLGTEHPYTATSLNGLAELYSAQGRSEQAEPLLRRALAIREQTLGAEHPDTAQSLWQLAILSLQQQHVREAELLYQRALLIFEHTLGSHHPSTRQLRAQYTSLLQEM